MSDVVKQSFPSLSVWVALFCIGGVIVFFITRLPSKDQLENEGIANWLEIRNTDSSKATLVIALGSSLTGSGLDSAQHLSEQIETISGRKVDVLKIWKINAGPATFSALDSHMRSLHPAVVAVEANLFFYAFIKGKGWPGYVQRFRDFVDGGKYNYQPDDKPYIRQQKIEVLETFRSGLMDTVPVSKLGMLLQRWHRQGAKIVLINFPLEEKLEMKKWNSKDTTVFFRNINYLEQYAPFTFLNERRAWPAEYFIDHAHLNKKGELRQSALFCEQVAKQLTTP